MVSGRSSNSWQRHEVPEQVDCTPPVAIAVAVERAADVRQLEKGVLMTGKSDFTNDEWNQLLQSVFLSGLAVTAAEPSGLFGSLKEAFASASTLAKAKADPNANELVKAVVASLASLDEASGAREGLRSAIGGAKNPAEVRSKAITVLAQLSTLLDTKAPS